MVTKYVKVPFNIEVAKKITNGSEDGKIVTNSGKEVRIVCFDMLNEKYPIVGLRKDDNYTETAFSFNLNGQCLQISEDNNLFLEVPRYMTFKDGDVIIFDEYETILIAKGNPYKNKAGAMLIDCYAVVINGYFYVDSTAIINSPRLATKEEKQKLIDAMKSSKSPRAKKYLKRFFGIEEEEIIEAEIKEEKSEYKFKPFDKVLVRDFKNIAWSVDFFSHYNNSGYRYNTLHGGTWKYCIPYNEQTAHLLGTTQNYG